MNITGRGRDSSSKPASPWERTFPPRELRKEFDAVCITIGAREARDLPIEGRELQGIHFALEYLSSRTGS